MKNWKSSRLLWLALVMALVLCMAVPFVGAYAEGDAQPDPDTCEHVFNDEGVCGNCGYECFHDGDVTPGSDAEYHYEVCDLCGARYYEGRHVSACDNPGVCADCGAYWAGMEVVHFGMDSDFSYDETHHWVYCTDCDEELFKQEHQPDEDDPEWCTVCDGYIPDDLPEHEWNEDVILYYDFVTHTFGCYDCDETLTVPHRMWGLTTDPTCTEQGYTWYACMDCTFSLRDDFVDAIGHKYDWRTCLLLGDGTHAFDCLNGCGERIVEACMLRAFTVGGKAYTLCAVCGDVRVDEGAAVPQVITKCIDYAQFTIDPAVEGERLRLRVYKQEVQEAAQDGSGEMATVLVTYQIMLVDQQGVQQPLNGKIRISIINEAEHAANARLVLALEDGSQSEFPCETDEARLVFETEQLGVFALAPVAE